MSLLVLLALASTACFPSVAAATDTECYDAKVRAKPLAQVPTVLPQFDHPGYIPIAWPWFVDLDVRRVIDGDMKKGQLQTLVILHTHYPEKTRTFYLRRNSAGSFNILRVSDPDRLERCPAGAAPAQPYLRLANEAAYEQARRDGEDAIRRYSVDDED